MIILPHWVVKEDWRVLEQSFRLTGRADGFALDNDEQLHDSLTRLVWDQPTGYYGNPVIPAGFPCP